MKLLALLAIAVDAEVRLELTWAWLVEPLVLKSIN